MPKYVDLEKVDVEKISCFYGSECRLSDVQDFLDNLPVEEGLERVVYCINCVFGERQCSGKCTCLKTNTLHSARYYCADGIKDLKQDPLH